MTWAPRFLPGLLALISLCVPPRSGGEEVETPGGLAIAVEAATGHYAIRSRAPDWTFAGRLGGAAFQIETRRASDRLGPYREIRFSDRSGAQGNCAIRAYDEMAVVLFASAPRTLGKGSLEPFPNFTSFPGGLHHFSYREEMFSPPSFTLERNGTPWLLFDDRGQAAVLSPADELMVASMSGDGVSRIASGLNPGLAGLPAGFTHRTLLAFGSGINAAWDRWGRALTDLEGRARPANDADIGLRYLGYWTDNGAHYYYNYDPSLGYEGTLAALVRRYRAEAIPIRYLQLDSWWYFKTLTNPDGSQGRPKNPKLPEGEWNRYGGLLRYAPHPAVLPHGLAGLHEQIGLPLITHNRWIDPESPYHRSYRISGVAAVDPRWWRDIMDSISAAGVVCYEQDWLNEIYAHSPALGNSPGEGEEFTDGMARAAQARGMSLQYCMGLPRCFLQGSRYDNLTTIRVSYDRFEPKEWRDFLYVSRLAASLGIWPWTDVFMSRETDNLLLATLSGGMVGTGDEMGRESRDNLMLSVRPDGVIVKPDAPIVPIDEMYLAEAAGKNCPMIAWTHADHGGRRTLYVFAFDPLGRGSAGGFVPASLGLTGQILVYDAVSGRARRMGAAETVSLNLKPGATDFLEIAPFGKSGIAFLGDKDKFVGNGRKRVASLEESDGGLTATVIFAAGEKFVRLAGYARSAPSAESRSGSVGGLSYDAATGRFETTVFPAAGIRTEMPGGDPIQEAVVSLRLRQGR